jgi:hypothetical protein
MPNLPVYVYAMLLAPIALLLFAAIYKSLQVRAARQWPSTPGRVVVSSSEVRDVRVLDDKRADGFRIERRNFANIVYEYSVSGQVLTNNRVSIDDDRGNFGIAESIARYPVGKAVTVYYNSLHPREAVLERDTPKGWWGCFGSGIAIALLIVFGSVFGLNQLTEFVSTRLGNPRMSAPAVFLAAFGSVLALFALALHRQASLASKWPVVVGTIEISDIEQLPRRIDQGLFARPVDVSAPGVIRLPLRQCRLQQRAGQPRHRHHLDLGLAGAQIHHGLPERRQRQRLCQSGQPI